MKKLIIFILLLSNVWAHAYTEQLNLKYGHHERNVFDLWQPERKDSATPIVIYIHGGGWEVGTKDEIKNNYMYVVKNFLSKKISYAAINYRFLKHAPLQTIMKEDIGGFIQFIRFNAKKLNIDKNKIFVYGSSAGGSASLWLATHDDLKDELSVNPLKQESTRVTAAAHLNAQVSYDYMVWYDIFGKDLTDKFIGNHVWKRYHLDNFEDLFTPIGIEIRDTLNMYGNMDKDDSPILFWNSLADDLDRDNNHFVHSPIHARELAKKAKEIGLTYEKWIKADGDMNHNQMHATVMNFFTKFLVQ